MTKHLNTNLQLLRKSRGLTQEQILDTLGFKRTTWNTWENGGAEPKLDDLLKIANYFDVSVSDLITEDLTTDAHLIAKAGKLRKTVKSTPKSTPNSTPFEEKQVMVLNEKPVPYSYAPEGSGPPFYPPRVLTVDTMGRANIVYVPVQERVRYVKGYEDPEFIKTLPVIYDPLYGDGTYRIFEIDGNANFNTLGDRDKLIARWTSVSALKDDYVYVFVTEKDGVIVSRILNRLNEGKVVCRFDNNHRGEYPPLIIDVYEIKEAWYGVEKRTRQLGRPGEIYKRVIDLEAEMIMLKDTMKQLKSGS